MDMDMDRRKSKANAMIVESLSLFLNIVSQFHACSICTSSGVDVLHSLAPPRRHLYSLYSLFRKVHKHLPHQSNSLDTS